jgi:hypothetical protein
MVAALILDGWEDRLGQEVQGNEHNQRRYDRDDISHAEKGNVSNVSFPPKADVTAFDSIAAIREVCTSPACDGGEATHKRHLSGHDGIRFAATTSGP